MIPFSHEGICETIKLVLKRNELILRSQMDEGHLTPSKLMMVHPANLEPVAINPRKWSKARKLDDLVAATLIGAVVLDAKHGADAVRVTEDGQLEYIELKLAIVDRETYWVNENGTIYAGFGDDENNRTSLKSNISGSFSHIGDPEEKRRATYLVVMDEDADAVIGAWRMSGDTVYDCLTRNQTKRIIPLTEEECLKKSRKRDIKLSTFIGKGEQVETFIPSIGIEALEAKIRAEGRQSAHARGLPIPARRKSKLAVVQV